VKKLKKSRLLIIIAFHATASTRTKKLTANKQAIAAINSLITLI